MTSVIASGAKQSSAAAPYWIASSRSLSSGRALRADPLAPRNDEAFSRCRRIRVLLTKLPMAPQAEGSGAPKGANGAALAKRGARLAIGALASRRSTRLLSSKTQLEIPRSVTGYAHKTRNRAGSSRPAAGCKAAAGNRTRSMFGYASRTCPSMNERALSNLFGYRRQETSIVFRDIFCRRFPRLAHPRFAGAVGQKRVHVRL
jgi:hypothetical protein